LPAGQLPGPAALEPVQAERGKPLPGRRHRRAAAGAGQQQGQRDVLFRGQLGHQLAGLEHEPEPVPAQRAAPVIAQGVQPLPAEPDLALLGDQDARQAVQQRGLARVHAVADALTGALVYQVLARDTAGTSTRRADGFLDVIMSGLQTTARPAQ
jgi:hypothetical protein